MRFRPGQHLRRQGDIRAVREQGRRMDCRAFLLWWRTREEAAEIRDLPRAGFVASRQAVGGAVQRNRAKRRMRELFRRHQALVPTGCDFLLVARQAVIRWDWIQLEHAFAESCARIATGLRPKP